MNTNIKVSKSDQRFFDELYPLAHPGEQPEHKKILQDQLNKGQMNIPALLETALSQVGHNKRVNTNGKDFVDFSDAKKTTARWRSKRTTLSANVSKVHNKLGVLRIMCYNEQLDKFYYFLIPREAYSHIVRTSNIEIPFMNDGTPQRGPGRLNTSGCKVIENWWNYEVRSFAELAQPMPMPTTDVTKDYLKDSTFQHLFT